MSNREAMRALVKKVRHEGCGPAVGDYVGSVEVCLRCQMEALLSAEQESPLLETLARWMIANGFTTGHGDTVEDLLRELAWQVKELRQAQATSVNPQPSDRERAQSWLTHSIWHKNCTALNHEDCLAVEFAQLRAQVWREALQPFRKVRATHFDWGGYLVHKQSPDGSTLEFDEHCPGCVIKRALQPEKETKP
jgi:hypothetical protein